jgi:hypothetical protein
MTVNVETVKASIDTLTNTTTTALTAIQAEIQN